MTSVDDADGVGVNIRQSHVLDESEVNLFIDNLFNDARHVPFATIPSPFPRLPLPPPLNLDVLSPPLNVPPSAPIPFVPFPHVAVPPIKFMTWNATGLRNRIDDLILYMQRQSIDFAVVTETWLRVGDSLPLICRSSSAVCSVLVGNRGKNGVSLIINPDSSHPEVRQLQILARDTIDGRYMLFRCGPVFFLGVYIPPASSDFRQWILDILSINNVPAEADLVLLGDFNARRTEWSDTSDNPHGEWLLELLASLDLHRADSGVAPSFVRTFNNQSSIPDHIVGNVSFVNPYIGPPVQLLREYHLPVVAAILPALNYSNRTRHGVPRLRLERIHDESVRVTLQEQGEIICNQLYFDVQTKFVSSYNNDMSTLLIQNLIDDLEAMVRSRLHNFARSVLGERPVWNGLTPFEVISTPEIVAARSLMLSDPSVATQEYLIKLVREEKIRLARSYFNSFNHLPPNDLFKKMSAHVKGRRRQTSALSNSVPALATYREHFGKMNRNDLPNPPNDRVIFAEDELDVDVDVVDPVIRTIFPSAAPTVPTREVVLDAPPLDSVDFIQIPTDPVPPDPPPPSTSERILLLDRVSSPPRQTQFNSFSVFHPVVIRSILAGIHCCLSALQKLVELPSPGHERTSSLSPKRAT